MVSHELRHYMNWAGYISRDMNIHTHTCTHILKEKEAMTLRARLVPGKDWREEMEGGNDSIIF